MTAIVYPLLQVSSATSVRSERGKLLALTFQIGHQLYGLPVDTVLEIIPLPALVELAGAPPTLCGLLNLRGHYLPVLSGRVLVGVPLLYDLSHQIVIIGTDAGHAAAMPMLGLVVDQVCDVITFQADTVATISGNAAAFLSGVAHVENSSVIFFDVPVLLSQVPASVRNPRPHAALL